MPFLFLYTGESKNSSYSEVLVSWIQEAFCKQMPLLLQMMLDYILDKSVSRTCQPVESPFPGVLSFHLERDAKLIQEKADLSYL